MFLAFFDVVKNIIPIKVSHLAEYVSKVKRISLDITSKDTKGTNVADKFIYMNF